MPALPSSTSESYLVARAAHAEAEVKPPSRPTKVRPFILRGTSATDSRTDVGRPSDRTMGDVDAAKGTGKLKKSKTSADVARQIEPIRPIEHQADENTRPGPSATRCDLAITLTTSTQEHRDRESRRGWLRSPLPPPATNASRPPVSLAAASLRALSSPGPPKNSSLRPTPMPRARPLSYVSTPTPSRSENTSPSCRRTLSFSTSPSPPKQARASRSSSPLENAPLRPESPKPVISPTRARALSPAASAAVEQHKLALKRRTLAARQGSQESLISHRENAGGISRSGRWFGRLASVTGDEEQKRGRLGGEAQEAREDMSEREHLDDPEQENVPPAPVHTPLPVSRRMAPLRRSEASAPFSAVTASAIDAGRRGKMVSRTALGHGRARTGPPLADASGPAVEDETAPGFSSLQELLERHGYADTRVVTPQAHKVRPVSLAGPASAESAARPRSPLSPIPAPAVATETNTLVPPAQENAGKSLKERSSLLSLRGWFSIFSAAPPSETLSDDNEDAAEVLADEAVANSTDSPQPRVRTASEVLHWVDGVNQELRPAPVHRMQTQCPHPLSQSDLFMQSTSLESTPQLVQYRSRDEDDTASARSYSSSLSLDDSPPTPHQAITLDQDEHALCPTIAISREHESPTKLRTGVPNGSSLLLRHAASDSHLLTTSVSRTALPRYESFSGLGISLPPSSPFPSPPHTPQRVATPPPAPGAFSGMWVPSLLRERASQLFSFSASSGDATDNRKSPSSPFASPIDAATGLSPSQRHRLSAARHDLTRMRNADRAPQLLRKAVSAGGLRVAAQSKITRAKVETKSSRESLGSLAPGPVVLVAVAGDMSSACGNAWGEDLLGRRW